MESSRDRLIQDNDSPSSRAKGENHALEMAKSRRRGALDAVWEKLETPSEAIPSTAPRRRGMEKVWEKLDF